MCCAAMYCRPFTTGQVLPAKYCQPCTASHALPAMNFQRCTAQPIKQQISHDTCCDVLPAMFCRPCTVRAVPTSATITTHIGSMRYNGATAPACLRSLLQAHVAIPRGCVVKLLVKPFGYESWQSSVLFWSASDSLSTQYLRQLHVHTAVLMTG